MKVVVQLIGKQNSNVNCFITKLLCKRKFIYLADMSVYTKLNNKFKYKLNNNLGTLLLKFFE